MTEQICKCKNIEPEIISQIQRDLPSLGKLEELAEFFKVFGDPSRLKILYYLSKLELCVNDLSVLAEMQQSTVSHQLKILRLQRLVKVRKEGVTSYYSLDDAHVEEGFKLANAHIDERD